MFQMVDADDKGVRGQQDGFGENYPPRLRAMILFSSLVGSWLAVVAAGYLLAHLI